MSAYRLFANCFLVFCILIGCPLDIGAAEQDYWRDAGVVRIGDKKSVKAPDFVLSTLDGRKVSLKDLRGKAVFLNFWATWCPPCVVEMPSMEALHKRFKGKGLVVLAVNDAENVNKVGSFIKKRGYTFHVLLDSDGLVTDGSYRVVGLPTTYLIDSNGMVVGKAEGVRAWDSPESFRLMEEIIKR